MTDGFSLVAVLVFWIVGFVLLLRQSWRTERPSVGLLLAFYVQLWIIHWVAGAIQLLPWHRSPERDATITGFFVTGYAMAGLLLGALCIAPQLVATGQPPRAPGPSTGLLRLGTQYVLVGLVCGFLLVPFSKQVASLTAIIGSGMLIAIVGFAIVWWSYWKAGQPSKTWLVFVWASIFPALNIFQQGFLGGGVLSMATVACFGLVFYRPRMTMMLTLIGGIFLGLSLLPNYMRARTDIRKAVWGQASYAERLEAVSGLGVGWEWFDPERASHLDSIEMRLNQNAFIGRAVNYLDAGLAEFANGETLLAVLTNMIPRALWPEKPTFAGSPKLVSRFTGLRFGEGTSVGLGFVMEFYVNFGALGVLFGFTGLGALLGCMDRLAAVALKAGTWTSFATYYVFGLALLDVGTNLAQCIVTGIGGVVVCQGLSALNSRSKQRPQSRRCVVVPPPTAFQATPRS